MGFLADRDLISRAEAIVQEDIDMGSTIDNSLLLMYAKSGYMD